MSRKDVSRTPVRGMAMGIKMRKAAPGCPWKVSPTHPQTYYFVSQDSQGLKRVNIIKIFNIIWEVQIISALTWHILVNCVPVQMSTPKSTK